MLSRLGQLHGSSGQPLTRAPSRGGPVPHDPLDMAGLGSKALGPFCWVADDSIDPPVDYDALERFGLMIIGRAIMVTVRLDMRSKDLGE